MTTPAHPDTVPLRRASDQRAPKPMEEAAARSLAADMWFRGVMIAVVCSIFIWLNSGVMSFVRDAFYYDGMRMAATPPMDAADRLVTSNVVMALIGATVVQTGVGFIAIATYLFPRRPS